MVVVDFVRSLRESRGAFCLQPVCNFLRGDLSSVRVFAYPAIFMHDEDEGRERLRGTPRAGVPLLID
jgi:hypothetical protein